MIEQFVLVIFSLGAAGRLVLGSLDAWILCIGLGMFLDPLGFLGLFGVVVTGPCIDEARLV